MTKGLVPKRYSKKRKNEVEIPDRIRNTPGLRLIKINKDDKKKPAEKDYLTKKNYALPSPLIEGWIRGEGNYGILAGFPNEKGEDLIIFDADELDRLRELGVLQKFPPTLTVRTGGGGEHRYYWIMGFDGKVILYDPVLKDEEGDFLHLGEILHKRFFVIGPGSIHSSGKRYEIIDDREIATIRIEQLREAIAGLKTKKKDRKENTDTYDSKQYSRGGWR